MFLATVMLLMLGDALAQQCEKDGYVRGPTCAASEMDNFGCCPTDALRAQWAEAERRRQEAARLEAERLEAERLEAIRNWTGPPGYEMVWIPAGSFTMGSPSSEPGRDDDEVQHEVRLTRGFWMGTTEVTQGLWQSVTGSNPSYFSNCGANCPVEQVSWYDAVKFANALSEREGLEACYVVNGERVSWPRGFECEGYRLPTEAEWEYAGRAGEGYLYAGSNELDSVAWTLGNSGEQTHPVAQKRPNGWGLYDMTGNVWEWTWDWYGSYANTDATDPVGPNTGSDRVGRGGSWNDDPRDARLADRGRSTPSVRLFNLGLRLLRSSP